MKTIREISKLLKFFNKDNDGQENFYQLSLLKATNQIISKKYQLY